jgi:hypothetical protein
VKLVGEVEVKTTRKVEVELDGPGWVVVSKNKPVRVFGFFPDASYTSTRPDGFGKAEWAANKFSESVADTEVVRVEVDCSELKAGSEFQWDLGDHVRKFKLISRRFLGGVDIWDIEYTEPVAWVRDRGTFKTSVLENCNPSVGTLTRLS